MQLLDLIWFIIVNAFAGFFQGIVGFGNALVAVPLSLTFLDKGTVLVGMLVTGATLNLLLKRQIKEPVDKSLFRSLFVASLLGMPLGVVALKLLPIDTLKIIVGSLSILFVVLLLFIKIHARHINRLVPLTGFICGLLITSTSMPGPPLVLLLTSMHMPKNTMRKMLATYFFWIVLAVFPFYLVSNIITWQGLFFGLCAIPGAILGGWIGNKVAHLIPQKWYRALALITVCATGAVAIYSGLR